MPWTETRVSDERMKFIAEFELEDESMAEQCRQYGISRKTGYKWLARWLAEVVSGQLHVKAVNNYVWQDPPGEWQRAESKLSWVTLGQLGTAPQGKDAFQFDASVTIAGAPASTELTAEAYVEVTVFYNDLADSVSRKFHATGNHPGFTFQMPGLVADSLFYVTITTQSALDESSALPGQDYNIAVEAYLDNFAFVPEPGTVGLLLAGGLALFGRRGRR